MFDYLNICLIKLFCSIKNRGLTVNSRIDRDSKRGEKEAHIRKNIDGYRANRVFGLFYRVYIIFRKLFLNGRARFDNYALFRAMLTRNVRDAACMPSVCRGGNSRLTHGVNGFFSCDVHAFRTQSRVVISYRQSYPEY